MPYGACWCGCGGKTTTAKQNNPGWGHVLGCPKRYLLGHGRRKSSLEYRIDRDTECWVWQRGRHDFGYGVTKHNGKLRLAHRVYYERAKGPIPDGYVVHHRCENPPCVNPSHLSLGTVADNNRDRENKGRTRGLVFGIAGDIQRAKTHCPQGHPYEGENVRFRPDGRRRCAACYRARDQRRRAAQKGT